MALAGVVANDSILLVNFFKHCHGDTKSVAEAPPRASQARFRAILLIPQVTSLAFGLIVTTVLVMVLVLFLVPATQSILDDFGLAKLD